MKVKIRRYWHIGILLLLIAIYTIVFSKYAILRHNSFSSNYDLGNMDQTIWNSLHGRLFSLSGAGVTESRFAIHADIILVALAPLYLIWNNVRILLIFQSLAIGLGAIPTYLISQKIINNRLVSLTVCAVYLLNPAIQWANIYDFHAVTLSMVLVLTTFYFALEKRWRLFFLFAVLSMTTKENIPLVIGAMGLLVAVFLKNWKVGLTTAAVAGVWFLTAVFVVIPYFSPTHAHWALAWYKVPDEQSELPDFLSPDFVIGRITEPDTISYYMSLIKPFSFLPLIGLPWSMLALPDLAVNSFSSQGQMRSIYYHYASGVISGLIIGVIFALSYIFKIGDKLLPKNRLATALKTVLVLILLAVAVRFNYHYTPLPYAPSCWCLTYTMTDEDRQIEQILKTIPPNASVTASGEIRAHLTHRQYAYNLPNAVGSVQYVAILTQDHIVGSYRTRQSDLDLANQLLTDPYFKLLNRTDNFYLFKRTS